MSVPAHFKAEITVTVTIIKFSRNQKEILKRGWARPSYPSIPRILSIMFIVLGKVVQFHMKYFDKFLIISNLGSGVSEQNFELLSTLISIFPTFSRQFYKFLLNLMEIFEKLPKILGLCPIVKFCSDLQTFGIPKNICPPNRKILHKLQQSHYLFWLNCH